MLKCKNCDHKLTKFDRDLCPYCGARNPIDDSSTETIDVTQIIDNIENIDHKEKFVRKSRKTYIILMMILGIFSAHLFYIKRYYQAAYLIGANALFIGGGGYLLSIFEIFTKSQYYLNWIVALGVVLGLYIILGTCTIFFGEPKDNDNEVLK
ncbi:MAG: hypothetical protein RR909_00280 [Bacilli bacterium]